MLARTLSWPIAPALMAGVVLVHLRRPGPAMTDVDATVVAAILPFLAGLIACWGVGVLLTWRVVHHRAGWAFLGLGTSLAWTAFTDSYADLALQSGARGIPWGKELASLGESSFIWWFLFVALALQFTPGGTPPRWRLLPAVTTVSAVVFQAAALLRSTPLEGPYRGIVSPWAIESLAGPLRWISFVAVLVTGLCLLASVALLVSAFRRSRGEVRQQLLWLVAGAGPLAPCVVASFAASFAGRDAIAGLFMSVAIITLALGAGFAVARYRLYDVERIVSGSVSYALSSSTVVAVFGLVVLVITRSVPTLSSSARWPTVVATLAAAGAARPAYVWARNWVDRRFNRRRFDAVQVVRTGLRRPSTDVEALLREALGDPTLRVLFAADDGRWVTSRGQSATVTRRTVDVVRERGLGARVEFDPARTESTLVQAVTREAAAEIENLGLRAELARQVEEVTGSRARLAGAHLEERQRIERDLHDGAQQRILAIALQLQSARVNGADAVLREEVDRAIDHLGLTVQDLRDLASGLQPAALAGGGLRAAIEDLANRIPIHLDLDVDEGRFRPNLESAAWFVVAEAVSNAVKHAGVDRVEIGVRRAGQALEVVVADHGSGGADPRGSGLQGLADRVAALGGTLAVAEQEPRGTRVEARFPCA